MGFRRGLPTVAIAIVLAGCGIVGTMAWLAGMWGLLTGAALVAIWLCALAGRVATQVQGMALPPSATSDERGGEATGDGEGDADAMVLRILLDAAPTPLLRIEDGTARALNRAARRLFATNDRILPMPGALPDAAVTHMRHDGRGWRIDRVAVADGRTVAALIDIEQEQRTAEARATAEMMQILGHELFNGLAPIASLAESGVAAIAAPAVDLALLGEILGTLARRAEGLQRFTETYRALARLPPPTLRPVRLRGMADDLTRLFAGRWPGIALAVTVEDAEWPLDRDQLDQAIWALLQNAAEAVAAASPAMVALRMHVADQQLVVAVEDNGAGVPAADVPHIFRPFRTTKPDGTGIGLTLAKQIALAHGGVLTLLPSPATTFRLVLPAPGRLSA